jgi:hypothetical protein
VVVDLGPDDKARLTTVPLGERAFSGLAVVMFFLRLVYRPIIREKRAPGGGTLLQETGRGKAAPDGRSSVWWRECERRYRVSGNAAATAPMN